LFARKQILICITRMRKRAHHPSGGSDMVGQGMIPVNVAALKLGVSREVAVRLIQRREIPGTLVGGRWLAEAGAVERYLLGRAERGELGHFGGSRP